MSKVLDKDGLTIPQVITDKILLEGEDLKDLVVKTDINLPTLSSRWDSDFAENIGWVKSEGQWLNGNVYRDAYDLMVSRIGVNDKFIEATEGTELTDENADKFLIDTTAVKFRLPLINGERVLVINNKNGNEWQQIYSDGYCEQGGNLTLTSTVTTKKFSYVFKEIPTVIFTRVTGRGAASYDMELYPRTITVSNFTYAMNPDYVSVSNWIATGITSIRNCSLYNCGNYLFFKLADEVPSTVVNTEQVVADLKQECDDFKAALEEKFNSGAFVTESWTNGTNWYRKYSDGWIEQGGFKAQSSTNSMVTLNTAFTNTNYTVLTTVNRDVSASSSSPVWDMTTSSFKTYQDYQLKWYACGY